MSTTEPNGAEKPTNDTTPATGEVPVADAAVEAPETPGEPFVAHAAAPAEESVPEVAPSIEFATEPVGSTPAAAEAEPVEEAPTAYAPAAMGVAAAVAAPVVADYAAQPSGTQPSAEQPYAAPVPNDAYPTPIYVQAPTPPVNKGNRGFGILVGLIGTAAFALIYAVVALVTAGVLAGEDATRAFQEFVAQPIFYVPIIAFFGAFALLAAITNRSGWWSWVLGGFFVAVVVYFSYIGAALLTVQAWTLTLEEAQGFLSTQWLYPLAIGAAVIAREVPIWFGAWISSRGRKVTERNVAARQEYDRILAEGPTVTR